ncbi:MAG: gamma-glutamylcyclotransferase [Rhodospirillales bacterium]|nr:MAG: gamma-glutamylcyclotransferase [Rhodospirillales bacterium]
MPKPAPAAGQTGPGVPTQGQGWPDGLRHVLPKLQPELWVFGYGSLMWDPGFAHAEALHARVYGYHRALCLLSVRNRGTPERPGLVLAMDRGGSCHGVAFRVPAARQAAALDYLWEREMYTGAYRPVGATTRLADGRRVTALAFVARPDHAQYCRTASAEHAARLVVQGHGSYGRSLDYLRHVVRHLDALGIDDGPLHRVLACAESLDDCPVAMPPP